MDTLAKPFLKTVGNDYVWPTVGRPGLVPVTALVRDPDQPRQHFDEREEDILAYSMKNGGGQREILTVAELTPEEMENGAYGWHGKHPKGYLIVSGERRWRAAQKAGLEMIEIRVRTYPTPRERRLEAFLLNESRVGLTDWENARYIAKLAEDFGWSTQEEIARQLVKDQVWVSTHLALLRLHPEIQARMKPEVHETNRIKRPTALLLGRFTMEEQGVLIGEMPLSLKTTTQQMTWITREAKERRFLIVRRRRAPRKVRKLVGDFCRVAGEKALALIESGDVEGFCKNASKEHVLLVLADIAQARERLKALSDKVETLSQARNEGRAGETKIPKPATVGAPPLAPVQAQSSVTARKAVGVPALKTPSIPHARLPSVSVSRRTNVPLPQTVNHALPQKGSTELTVEHYDERLVRVVLAKVDLKTYVELWDKGHLGFQRKRKQKPDYLPTREEAITRLAEEK